MQGEGRVAVWLAVACFLFFAAFHHGHFRGSDEFGLLQVTRSLHDGGTLAVPRILHTGRGADGRYYSHFSVGQSALALPFLALGRALEAILPPGALRALAGPELGKRNLQWGGSVDIFAVGFYAPVVGGLLVAVFFLFERALGISLRTAVVCALLFGTTTYVALLSTFFLRHTSEALTIVGGLCFFYRWKLWGRSRDLWIGSSLAALTPLVRLPASVAAPALAGYLGWCLWERSGRRWDARVVRHALPCILVPLLAALALSAASDVVKWGVPWNIHQLRTGSSLEGPLVVSVYAALFSPGMSVFVYSPLLLLAPWTFPVLWRRRRAEALAFLALALTFLLVFSSFTAWTGLWSAPGPRYQLLAVPLFLLPLGLWLDERPGSRARRAWVAALGATGLFVQCVMMSVRWGGLIEAMGYRTFHPKWAFLFLPEYSPILGAVRLVGAGSDIDLWLVTLARGWPGQEPLPGLALGIAGVWVLLLAGSLALLARAVRRQA